MQKDILFDNIYIGHSVEDAQKLADEAWKPKRDAEKLVEEAQKPKEDPKPESPLDLKFTDDPVTYVKEKISLFVTLAKKDPIQAIQFVPEAAGGLLAVVLGLIAVIINVAKQGPAAPAPKKADGGKPSKEKSAQGAATGADTGKAEVTKRNTRSQQS